MAKIRDRDQIQIKNKSKNNTLCVKKIEKQLIINKEQI